MPLEIIKTVIMDCFSCSNMIISFGKVLAMPNLAKLNPFLKIWVPHDAFEIDPLRHPTSLYRNLDLLSKAYPHPDTLYFTSL